MTRPTYEELEAFVRTVPRALEGHWFGGEYGDYNNDGVISTSEKASELINRLNEPKEDTE